MREEYFPSLKDDSMSTSDSNIDFLIVNLSSAPSPIFPSLSWYSLFLPEPHAFTCNLSDFKGLLSSAHKESTAKKLYPLRVSQNRNPPLPLISCFVSLLFSELVLENWALGEIDLTANFPARSNGLILVGINLSFNKEGSEKNSFSLPIYSLSFTTFLIISSGLPSITTLALVISFCNASGDIKPRE